MVPIRYYPTITLMVVASAVTLQAAVTRAGEPPQKGSRTDSQGELETLLLDRPSVPVTKPEDYREPGEPTPKLPEDGSMVIDRRCHIERDRRSGWCRVVFEDESGDANQVPRWALPSGLLETMEQVAAGKPGAIFRISGENTIYDERSFILLQKAVLELTPPPKPTTSAASSRPTKPADRAGASTTRFATTSAPAGTASAKGATKATSAPATRSASTVPTTKYAGSAPRDTASSDEILRELRRDRLGAPVVPDVRPSRTRPNEPSVAPLPKGRVLSAARGGAVVDRLVTLVPADRGGWMQVRFESDNTLREPPLRLLPCAILRKAELIVASAQKGKTMRLRVSGLLTHYRGKRFLLLRKVLLERDLGRF